MRLVEAKRVVLDGEPVWKFRCPGCGVWGICDEDQAAGACSCVCPECGWHETVQLTAGGEW